MEELYELHVETRNGTRWYLECVSDKEHCLEHATELDGSDLVFHISNDMDTLKATGESGVYFIKPSRRKKENLSPGSYCYEFA